MFLDRLYCKQYEPRSDCSLGAVWSELILFTIKIKSSLRCTWINAADLKSRLHFQDKRFWSCTCWLVNLLILDLYSPFQYINRRWTGPYVLRQLGPKLKCCLKFKYYLSSVLMFKDTKTNISHVLKSFFFIYSVDPNDFFYHWYILHQAWQFIKELNYYIEISILN